MLAASILNSAGTLVFRDLSAPEDRLLSGNMMTVIESTRVSRLKTVAIALVALLFVKVLLTILYEYRLYFPANFDAAFLSGRRDTFVGLYRVAFYAHIVSGPSAIMLVVFLMITGGRVFYRNTHRWAGRALSLIVLFVVAPSGLMMAYQSHAGPVAASGFATLALGSAICITAAVSRARSRQFQSHQQWAIRGFILLCSPLLSRLVAGALIVLQLESDWSYRLNAWLSWLVPLAIYEVWRLVSAGTDLIPFPSYRSRPRESVYP